MAFKRTREQYSQMKEKKVYFSSSYGLKQVTGMAVGVEAYVIPLGLEQGIYETPTHTLRTHEVNGQKVGFKGNLYNSTILCKGVTEEGERVDSLCCKIAQMEKERFPERDDSSKRGITFTTSKVHIPVLVLSNSLEDKSRKQVPVNKLSIQTYSFSFLDISSKAFEDLIGSYAESLKNDGEIDYDLTGSDLTDEVIERLQKTIIKIKGVPAKSSSLPYERAYSFIPFSKVAIGKDTQEYEAITNYLDDKDINNAVVDFMSLFNIEVENLVTKWEDKDLEEYYQSMLGQPIGKAKEVEEEVIEEVEVIEPVAKQVTSKKVAVKPVATTDNKVETAQVSDLDDIDDIEEIAFDADDEDFFAD